MRLVYLFVFYLLVFSNSIKGQTVFELKTSPNIVFDFNTIQEYVNGITYMNAVTLNINTTDRFDLYVGANTTVVGLWDEITTYSNIGDPPTIDMMKLQFRNANSTSLMSGFFPLQDILNPTYIIGSNVKPDGEINCPLNGTNAAGDYLTDPGCYKFVVDLRIVPGFTYRSGQYYLKIDFVIISDL